MSVNDVYVLFLYILNKNSGQGDVSPDEFNVIMQQAESSYMDYLLGELQQYTQARPVPRIQFGNNQKTRQTLTPFIYGYVLNVDNTGYVAYPGDYIQTDAMFTYSGNNRIRYCQQDSLWSFYNSRIDPYKKYPFYLIEDTGFRFYPNDIGNARLSYVRTPNYMKWGYNIDVNGLPVYDASKSVQPEWLDNDILQIIIRGLRIAGINLQLPAVVQYAAEIKQIGQ